MALNFGGGMARPPIQTTVQPGQATYGQPTPSPLGGTAAYAGPTQNQMGAYFQQNPQALEGYWANNPGQLTQAVGADPHAFGANPAPARMEAYLQRNPHALENYWKANPNQVGEAVRNNPQAFGADPNSPSTIIGGTPYNAAGVPQTGLLGSENALHRGLQAGIAGVEGGVNQATETLSTYTEGGGAAYDLQAALSGALGPQAQTEAYANYQESPGQAYLRDQGERAITRNASATGGLQGGNVLQALQRHGIGIAAQDFDANFNRLGSLSDKGYGASQSLGGIQANAGARIGDYGYGTGQNLASGRTRAGEQIAGNVSQTTSALADLVNQQGTDLAGMTGTAGSSLANLLQGLGINDAQSLQGLATLLANNSQGAATGVAGLHQLGTTKPWAAQEGYGKLLSSLGNIAGGFANSQAAK